MRVYFTFDQINLPHKLRLPSPEPQKAYLGKMCGRLRITENGSEKGVFLFWTLQIMRNLLFKILESYCSVRRGSL